ncbi:MAG: DNA repair exonuclease [Clostridiales bacterium]|nr:DNA repair exonuclease [Clostridiales bacterium]
MRILHIADLHLGAKNSKLPKENQDLLKDEMLENCYKLFTEIGKIYDAIVICGDLFHSKNIAIKIINTFFACVKEFQKPVIYVAGNHDEKVEFLNQPENFIVLDQVSSIYETQDCVFYSAEYTQDIDKTRNAVLLLHGNIENTQDGDFVDINPFLNKGFDYIALGHIHTVAKYKKGMNIFAYSGSLFSNGFDECGEKGYIDVEIKDKQLTKCEFKVLPQRSYVICEIDITNAKSNKEIILSIKDKITNMDSSSKDIVRVVLKGYYDETLNKSIPLIKDAFDDFFYIEFIDNTKLKIDIDGLKKESLSLKNEFISLVENANLDEEYKRKIINLGIEALKGDDLSI